MHRRRGRKVHDDLWLMRLCVDEKTAAQGRPFYQKVGLDDDRELDVPAVNKKREADLAIHILYLI
jgi:hypothetical protein